MSVWIRPGFRKQFADFRPIYGDAIYGVAWDKSSTSVLTRTNDAVGMVANAGIDMVPVINDFDTAQIYSEMVEIEDSLGNVFIRIPKFYIRKVDGENFKSWQISKKKHPGFYLPWCFWDFTTGREKHYIDVGKYKATLGAGNKLESKPDAPPLVGTNIVNMRTYAENNNVNGLLGYQQLDIHVMDVLQTLFYVEFATLDSQSIMQGFVSGRYGNETELATADTVSENYIVVSNTTGAQYRVGQTISVGTARYGVGVFYGRTITNIEVDTPGAGSTKITFDGDPVSITTGNFLQNTGWVNGFSTGIAASSGCIVANDGKYPCMYRGIESPWGDTYQFVDGVNINDWQAWVCKNAAEYASNVFAHPYEQLEYVNKNEDNYVLEMGHDSINPYAEFPVSVGASGDSGYKDYYYQTSGQRIARVGGSWHDGAFAGLSFWSLTFSSTDAGVHRGGRLLKKPL